MTKNYPSYRFSTCHKMALVRDADEDAAIAHWHQEPQEGFISPKDPHFVGVDRIPEELLAPVEDEPTSELDDDSQPKIIRRRRRRSL